VPAGPWPAARRFEALYAPRRRVLDAILADAARRAGAAWRRILGRIASFGWAAEEIGGSLLELGGVMAEEAAAMAAGGPGWRLELASA
jgi:hypothetical protein